MAVACWPTAVDAVALQRLCGISTLGNENDRTTRGTSLRCICTRVGRKRREPARQGPGASVPVPGRRWAEGRPHRLSQKTELRTPSTATRLLGAPPAATGAAGRRVPTRGSVGKRLNLALGTHTFGTFGRRNASFGDPRHRDRLAESVRLVPVSPNTDLPYRQKEERGVAPASGSLANCACTYSAPAHESCRRPGAGAPATPSRPSRTPGAPTLPPPPRS